MVAASSSDSSYNGLNPADVRVSNTDNEGVSFCLPDTGQTGDYTSTFGEDSDYTYSAISYSDNGDGTVTDGNTGLIWQQQDDGTERNWNVANSYCNALSLGGQSDWRLPTDKELMSIAHFGTNTSIYSTFFLNTQSSYYWTLTTWVNNTTFVWNVDNGYVDINSKTGSNYVRCVRGNQLSSSFTNNCDGTVTDNKTRFVWQREDDGSKRDWESAITYCESLSLGSNSDWRLPNIKELQSITDAGQSSPAINSTAFPNTQSAYYWSSTTYLTDTTIVWSIPFNGVYVYQSRSKSVHTNYVRCVRGGQ